MNRDKILESSVSTPAEQIFSDNENPLKEKALMRMKHEENPELANDLIEWEDDGEGHFLPC